MGFREESCLIGLCVLIGATSLVAAQEFAADQFIPLLPGITASVVQEVGPDACGYSAPRTVATSFACMALAVSNNEPLASGGGMDATGALYQIRERPTTAEENNLPLAYSGKMFEIERRTASGVELVAQVPEFRELCHYFGPPECTPGCLGGDIVQMTRPVYLTADQVNGDLLLVVQSRKTCGSITFGNGYAMVKLSGLPSLLDIILSYQPPSTLSFNVPVRPEGLVGADSFSVYAGDVSTVADLSQATPLQCIVPAGRPPVPGEQLMVPDPLPDPALGDARYYLAAVNHQGQRRAGRTAMNGVVQGRNAAALAGCP